jgi:hypothetical protein
MNAALVCSSVPAQGTTAQPIRRSGVGQRSVNVGKWRNYDVQGNRRQRLLSGNSKDHLMADIGRVPDVQSVTGIGERRAYQGASEI